MRARGSQNPFCEVTSELTVRPEVVCWMEKSLLPVCCVACWVWTTAVGVLVQTATLSSVISLIMDQRFWTSFRDFYTIYLSREYIYTWYFHCISYLMPRLIDLLDLARVRSRYIWGRWGERGRVVGHHCLTTPSVCLWSAQVREGAGRCRVLLCHTFQVCSPLNASYLLLIPAYSVLARSIFL